MPASLSCDAVPPQLDVSSCVGLEDLSPLGSCGQLRLLRATGCTKLRCLDGLARCTALRTARTVDETMIPRLDARHGVVQVCLSENLRNHAQTRDRV